MATSQVGAKSGGNDDLLLWLAEGAFETPPWSRFLDELRRCTGADYASLVFRPPGLPSSTATTFHLYSGDNFPPPIQKLYRDGFYRRDPMPYHEMREGHLYALGDLLQQNNPVHAAYIETVITPSGMNSARLMRIVEPSGVSAWLTVTRRRADFKPRHEALLKAIQPFLRAAIRGFVALERERTHAVLSDDVIQRLSFGWITLDGDGRVLEADTRGQLILERSSILRRDARGRLKSSTAQKTREILDVIKPMASAQDAKPRAIILSRDPWLDMLLVPANRSSISANSAPAVVAYIHRDASFTADRCEQLAQLFNLLPSEARLALALGRGLSISEAAQEVNLTEGSARTYSKRIYAKMGARGHADLVLFVQRSILRIA